MPIWFTRLLISLIIIFGAYGAYLLLKQRSLRAAAHQRGFPFRLEAGKKALIYFSSPDCGVCRSAQKPALDQLRDAMDERLKIIEINAYENEKLARDWGVLSVPATILLDEQGNPLAVNYGLASFRKLLKQFN